MSRRAWLVAGVVALGIGSCRDRGVGIPAQGVPEDQSSAARVTIRVAAGGAPVADAGIRWAIDRRPAMTAAGAARFRASTVTDGGGEATIETPSWATAEMTFAVWVFERRWIPVEIGACPEEDTVIEFDTKSLPVERFAYVSVVDEDGTAIAGASIQAAIHPDAGPDSEVEVVVCGPDGRARLGPLYRDTCAVDTAAAGYSGVRHFATLATAGGSIEPDVIVLPRARVVRANFARADARGCWLQLQYELSSGWQTWSYAMDDGTAHVALPLSITSLLRVFLDDEVVGEAEVMATNETDVVTIATDH